MILTIQNYGNILILNASVSCQNNTCMCIDCYPMVDSPAMTGANVHVSVCPVKTSCCHERLYRFKVSCCWVLPISAEWCLSHLSPTNNQAHLTWGWMCVCWQYASLTMPGLPCQRELLVSSLVLYRSYMKSSRKRVTLLVLMCHYVCSILQCPWFCL